MNIKRLKTPVVKVGKIALGGTNPIRIQSMTNTETSDAKATAAQCIELFSAGAELIRLTVDDAAAARAIPEIRQILNEEGYEDIPLIGDFHFNGHKLLNEYPQCAKTLDKYRINPGNVGYAKAHNENFRQIIEIAVRYNKPVRIGVNIGSLDPELLKQMMDKPRKATLAQVMVKSALESARLAEKYGMNRNRIILSVKMSEVPDMLAAYELLAKEMIKNKTIYALHIGLTEAGSGSQGLISSSAALAILLKEGLGDTIRISLTPAPNEARSKEVEACKLLLQSLGLRSFRPKVTSCPGCGRASGAIFQDLAAEVNKHLEENMKTWLKKYPGIEDLKIAVMGCVVNGPGEAKYADIAIALPGKNERNIAPVYINGKLHKTISGGKIAQEFIDILEAYIAIKYSF